MSTKDNLKEAFAGESQANRKYLAFSRKAKKEGLEKVSRLFEAVAEAETIHALKHLQTMDGVGSTKDNLKAAVAGEQHEFEVMYPAFIKEAEKEDNYQARVTFHYANKAEEAHYELYKKALEAVEQEKDFPAEKFYLCPVCGYIETNDAPDRCPICGAPAASFKEY
jgi:rubrerythrin